MWIFLNNAALSVVESNDSLSYMGCHRQDLLLVRARIEGDIERVFPEVVVWHTPNADYAYRVFMPRSDVAAAMVASVMKIDYDNFKNSIDYDERDRHDAYLDVWTVMRNYQQRAVLPPD
jgi:hypothetical protein